MVGKGKGKVWKPIEELTFDAIVLDCIKRKLKLQEISEELSHIRSSGDVKAQFLDEERDYTVSTIANKRDDKKRRREMGTWPTWDQYPEERDLVMGSINAQGMTRPQNSLGSQQTNPLGEPQHRVGPSSETAPLIHHQTPAVTLAKSAQSGHSNAPTRAGRSRRHREALKLGREARHQDSLIGQAEMQTSLPGPALPRPSPARSPASALAGLSTSQGRQNPKMGTPGAPRYGGTLQGRWVTYNSQRRKPQATSDHPSMLSNPPAPPPAPPPASTQQYGTQHRLPPMHLPRQSNSPPSALSHPNQLPRMRTLSGSHDSMLPSPQQHRNEHTHSHPPRRGFSVNELLNPHR